VILFHSLRDGVEGGVCCIGVEGHGLAEWVVDSFYGIVSLVLHVADRMLFVQFAFNTGVCMCVCERERERDCVLKHVCWPYRYAQDTRATSQFCDGS
jgi:hypothetical protein